MSLNAIKFRIGAGRSDRKRDRQIPIPTGVCQTCGISYGPYGKWNKLDIYRPEKDGVFPMIVNVHGGGYIYGTKEIYKRYCMDLARRGFVVINLNYRLAPRWKFPAPLEDLHRAMLWAVDKGTQYHADTNNIFMVGDSAGAQLASQYAAMLTNPEYMSLFGSHRTNAGIHIRALGLNCGFYDLGYVAKQERQGMELDYLGKKIPGDDPRLDVLSAITPAFPPAHITTASHDFLRGAAQPMLEFLQSKGIPCRLDIYGSEADTETGHVFHVNILKPEAIRCNDEQCAFFRSFL